MRRSGAGGGKFMRISSGLLVAAAVVGLQLPASVSAADEVLVWHDLLLDTYRLMGGCPCPLSRVGGMTSGAIFDAVNSIDGSYQPYLTSVPASPTASKEAAVAQAAHDVLVELFPSLQAEYDAQLIASLGAIVDGPEKTEGIQVGATVAAEMIAARQDDGWNNYQSYQYGNAPGEWRPTWPDFLPPCNSHWGTVTPWGIPSGEMFRPSPPPTLDDPIYADFIETKALGKVNSVERNSDQYTNAWFWANDRDGSYKPVGHMIDITRIISQQYELSMVENARLFALASIAMADAAICAWDAKYLTDLDFWRPIQGIRLADQDGNPNTIKDGSWVPLGIGSPAFPAYISGHACFAASCASVIRNYFGTDDIAFTCTTDDPRLLPGVTTQSYNSLTEAVTANGRSRVFLGVHWQNDCDRGIEVGTQVGDYIFANYMQPAPSSVDPFETKFASTLSVSRIAPNPSRHSATVELVLPVDGRLDLGIYDPSGRRVYGFDPSERQAGSVSLEWNLVDMSRRQRVPAGVYFVKGQLVPTSGAAPVGPSEAQARLVVLP